MYRGMLCACVVFGIATPAAARADEPRKLKVLVIDGAPRWEYRQLRSRLERTPDAYDPRFLLLSADAGGLDQDKKAVRAMPPFQELLEFDVVVLGDCNPKDLTGAKDLAAFVREGRGLVVVAGPHHTPHDWKQSALADVLPVRLGEKPELPRERLTGYRPVLTAAGKKHPAFTFKRGEKDPPWDELPEMFGWAAGYTTAPAAEVLATHPTEKTPMGDPLPLVVAHTFGNGKCVFVGFDETWRWRYRTNDGWHAHFWTAMIRSAARTG